MLNTFKYDNGLRLIHHSSPTNVAYCGIAIDAGSRDEYSQEHGIAHFCEHALFKGTVHRNSWHILNRMEAVGGDLNAFTTKEDTVVYSAFMKDHFKRAVELICDIVFNSTFPEHEIEKEREVIVEEIESYQDSPADMIFDQFESQLFSGHALGHDILATTDEVRRYKSCDLRRFYERMYRPERMVFFVFGNYDFNYVKDVVGEYTSAYSAAYSKLILPPVRKRCAFHAYRPEFRHEQHDTHQAHVMLGSPAYSSDDDRRIALYFLNNIIGGPGMNSLLNVALREHHGLVYTVDSSLTHYTDTTTFAIYFGCDANDVEKCLRIVRKEFDGLMSAPLNSRKYNAYMKQIKGQIGVSCDNFESTALDMGKMYLHYDKFDSINETYELLDSISPELVHEVAKEVLSEQNLSTLVFSK